MGCCRLSGEVIRDIGTESRTIMFLTYKQAKTIFNHRTYFWLFGMVYIIMYALSNVLGLKTITELNLVKSNLKDFLPASNQDRPDSQTPPPSHKELECMGVIEEPTE